MRYCAFNANMDIGLFNRMLSYDSTSGREGEFAAFLAQSLVTEYNRVEILDVGDGTCNLLFSWGEPKVVFCSHLDTVPPYIAPDICPEPPLCHPEPSLCHPERSEGSPRKITGRGTCDAKGQIFAMWEACKELEAKGCDGFGLLLLAGEETGSYGAKAFDRMLVSGGVASIAPDAWVIVGEPTDNCMAIAAKGTKSFEVTFKGEAFHSGYPQYGLSAVEMFNDFMNALRSIRFPYDELLGDTTWNIGRLISDNPQNILSEKLSCRVYFRTTFESDEMVSNIMKNMAGPDARLRFGRPKAQDGSDIAAKEVAQWQKSMTVAAFGGDAPTRFDTLEGFETKPVSFGSDAPQLTGFSHKILCGPGSILVAHRDDEHILVADMETAVKNYVRMYEMITKK